MKEYGFLIGGEWRKGSSPAEVRFPYDNSVIARVHHAAVPDLEDAAAAAARGFGTTRRLSSYRKALILSRLADDVRLRAEELAHLLVLEGGKTISFARAEVQRAAATLQISAEEAKRLGGETLALDWTPETEGRWGMTRRIPIGPVYGIVPFNFPLNLACHKLGPAIAAGNSIILKPSSATPVSALVLAEMTLNAGYPAEALSVVPCPGDTAVHLAGDPRIAFLSFTGSARVGWHIRSISGRKKTALELGGNAAVIVHDDAHLTYAVDRIVTGGFSNAGQVCISVQRVFLQKRIYETALALIIERTAALKVGDPREDSVEVGPMITPDAAARAADRIQAAVEEGAILRVGGSRKGAILMPAVISDSTPEMAVNREEIFAPVITVTPYDDFSEALSLANATDFGLQLGVFTQNINRILRAFEDAEVGGVQVNDIPTFRVDQMPYGGVKGSGMGREGPRYAIEEMTELRLLCINPAGGA